MSMKLFHWFAIAQSQKTNSWRAKVHLKSIAKLPAARQMAEYVWRIIPNDLLWVSIGSVAELLSGFVRNESLRNKTSLLDSHDHSDPNRTIFQRLQNCTLKLAEAFIRWFSRSNLHANSLGYQNVCCQKNSGHKLTVLHWSIFTEASQASPKRLL